MTNIKHYLAHSVNRTFKFKTLNEVFTFENMNQEIDIIAYGLAFVEKQIDDMKFTGMNASCAIIAYVENEEPLSRGWTD